jgi:hypothetical protein
MKKYITIIFFVNIFYNILVAQGTTAGDFLKIPVAANVVSRGDAGVALTGTSATMLYNPSLLTTVKQKEVCFTHVEYIKSKYETLVYSHPLPQQQTVGVFLGYFYTEEVLRTIIDKTVEEGYKEIGVYTNNFKTLLLSYAKEVNEKTKFGFALRYLQEKLVDWAAEGYSFDIGLAYYIEKNFVLAAAVQNIGSGLKFLSKEEEMPIVTRIGTEYTTKKFVVNNEIQINNDNTYHIKLGTEIKLADIFYISCGYNYSEIINYLGFLSGVTVGGKLKIVNYALCYSLGYYSEFGFVHRITFVGRF